MPGTAGNEQVCEENEISLLVRLEGLPQAAGGGMWVRKAQVLVVPAEQSVGCAGRDPLPFWDSSLMECGKELSAKLFLL